VILFSAVRKITASRENRGELLGDEVLKTVSHRNWSVQQGCQIYFFKKSRTFSKKWQKTANKIAEKSQTLK